MKYLTLQDELDKRWTTYELLGKASKEHLLVPVSYKEAHLLEQSRDVPPGAKPDNANIKGLIWQLFSAVTTLAEAPISGGLNKKGSEICRQEQ